MNDEEKEDKEWGVAGLTICWEGDVMECFCFKEPPEHF
jgi:hypothetical protein